MYVFFAVGDDGRVAGSKALSAATSSAEAFRLSHVLGQPLGGDTAKADPIITDLTMQASQLDYCSQDSLVFECLFYDGIGKFVLPIKSADRYHMKVYALKQSVSSVSSRSAEDISYHK